MHVTLFTTSDCVACKEVQPLLLELMELWAIPLEVRKPTLRELSSGRIPGYPALLLPFLKPPKLLVGSHLVQWLRENEDEVRHGYRLSDPECHCR